MKRSKVLAILVRRDRHHAGEPHCVRQYPAGGRHEPRGGAARQRDRACHRLHSGWGRVRHRGNPDRHRAKRHQRQRGDTDTYQATAYAGRARDRRFVYGDLSIGSNDFAGRRHISFPGVDRLARADYGGEIYTGFASTGYHFSRGELTITPQASLRYTHVDTDAYTERGAGDINLNVGAQDYDFFESGLGVKVARPYACRDGTYAPDFHAEWLHLLHNPTLENTATFAFAGSPSFKTPRS